MRDRTNVSNRQLFIAAVLLYSVIFSGCASDSAVSNETVKVNNSNSTSVQPVALEKLQTSNSSANTNSGSIYYDADRRADGERYAEISENPFLEASRAPLSTFSIDVDTAAYSNVRRFLNQ